MSDQLIDALSTDAGSRFPTHIAWNSWRAISRKMSISVIDSFASFSFLAVSLVVAVEVALVVDAAQTTCGQHTEETIPFRGLPLFPASQNTRGKSGSLTSPRF